MYYTPVCLQTPSQGLSDKFNGRGREDAFLPRLEGIVITETPLYQKEASVESSQVEMETEPLRDGGWGAR